MISLFCNGTFFRVASRRLYCCPRDNTVLDGVRHEDDCPNCNRMIHGNDVGSVQLSYHVNLPHRRIEIPEVLLNPPTNPQEERQ